MTARHAFTLIELLVAMAVGLTVLVLAVATFRSVSASLADITRISRETHLLRTGYLLALRDADFWDSHANPNAPYHKGFLRKGRGLNSSLQQRRLMAPISFDGSMDPQAALADAQVPNPNQMMAHHPGSWYRNGLHPSLGAGINDVGAMVDPRDDWRFNVTGGAPPRMREGDLGLTAATAMPVDDRFPALAWDGGVGSPYGYPTHGYLDTSHPGSPDAGDAAYRRMHSARPRAMLQMFQRLGHRGWIEYMPNHTPINVADQDGWLPGHTSRPTLSGAASDTRWVGNHWFGGLFGGTANSSSWSNVTVTGFFKVANQAGADILGLNRMAFHDGSDAGPNLRAIAATTWTNGLSSIDEADTYTVQASGESGNQYFGLIQWNRSDLLGDISRWPAGSTMTLRLPYNLADQEQDHVRLAAELGGAASQYQWLDVTSKPADVPMLRTSITRFTKFMGSNICVVRTVVEDPATGFRRELTIVPMSTTLRGARQHWALTHLDQGGGPTTADSAGNEPIGDFYP